MNDRASQDPTFQQHDEKVHKVEILISNLLRSGVIVSLFLIVFGFTLSFVHHPDYSFSRSDLHHLTQPGAAFPTTLHEVFAGVAQFQGRAITVLGLLLLILTPVMRVAVSIFAFVYEKDSIFVVVTSIVLALLILSFFLGRVEG